jgi:hypothetical protein
MATILLNRWVQLALAAVVAMFFFNRWMAARDEIAVLGASLEAQKSAIKEAVDANQSNQVTITDLQKRLNELVSQRKTDAEEREKVLSQRDQELAAMRASAAAERRRNRELFRSTASCEGLAELRIDLACPAIADRLRERSAGQGGH